jgi:hypothetical protein
MPGWTIPLLSLTVLIMVQLAGICFWLGKLSADHGARIKTLETTAANDISTRDEVIRTKIKIEGVEKTLEAIERSMQGMQRQLANIATHGLPKGFAAE